MSILVHEKTRLMVQGITGDFGARHARLSLDYGTQLVAGVTPGKGGQVFEHNGFKVPIFNTVAGPRGPHLHELDLFEDAAAESFPDEIIRLFLKF